MDLYYDTILSKLYLLDNKTNDNQINVRNFDINNIKSEYRIMYMSTNIINIATICDEDFSKKIKPIIDCSKKVLKPEELQFINIPNLLLLDDNNTETILECYNDKNYSIHSTDGTIKIFHFPNLQIEK